jgi:hypothetical protein
MTVPVQRTMSDTAQRSRTEATSGEGWVAFSGVMVFIAGVLNCIWGIAAIDNANFFVNNTQFILSDLNTWGWIVLLIGLVQLSAAVSIFSGNEFGRWVGILGAGVGCIGALLSIPAYPFWSLAVFSLEVLVMYGLVVYGGRRATV